MSSEKQETPGTSEHLPTAILPRRPVPEITGPLELDQLPLDKAKRIPEVLSVLYKSVMREGTDYGKVPGTQKPSLWKPGAEILARSLNLSADISIVDKIEQTDPEQPYFDYTILCALYGKNGFVGAGMGSCNSREPRYAFRWVYENQVPTSLDKSKLATRSAFAKTQYRVPTPSEEIFGIKNTVLKMAEKRSFVDVVLRVTGASRIFTQDVEDQEPREEREPESETRRRSDDSTSHPRQLPSSSASDTETYQALTEYPLPYNKRNVGIVKIDRDKSEVVFIPEKPIREDCGPVKGFMQPRILEPLTTKHKLQYRLDVRDGILQSVRITPLPEPEQLEELMTGISWTFAKGSEANG